MTTLDRTPPAQAPCVGPCSVSGGAVLAVGLAVSLLSGAPSARQTALRTSRLRWKQKRPGSRLRSSLLTQTSQRLPVTGDLPGGAASWRPAGSA